jgi:hypothetical protein
VFVLCSASALLTLLSSSVARCEFDACDDSKQGCCLLAMHKGVLWKTKISYVLWAL